jgi:hypothetical protein
MAGATTELERYFIDVYIQGAEDIPRQTYRVPVASFSHTRFPVQAPLPNIPQQRMYFTKTEMRPRILFNADEVCRLEVSKAYVSERISSSQILMVMYEARPGHALVENTRGFILGQFTEDKGMYLDVVCSSKYGLHLIDYFVILARQLEMSYIKLNSLPKVLSLYPRYGFRHRKSCSVNPDIEMSPELTATWKQYHSFSPDDFYMDPTALHYMHALHRHGYTADARVECQNPWLSAGEFALYKCAMDGFQMRLCLQPSARSPRAATLPSSVQQSIRAQGTKRVLRIRTPKETGKGKRSGKGTLKAMKAMKAMKGKKTKKTMKTMKAKKTRKTKKNTLRRSTRLQTQKKFTKRGSNAMNLDED